MSKKKKPQPKIESRRGVASLEEASTWLIERGIHVVETLDSGYSKKQIDKLVSFLLRREPLLKRRLMLRTLSSS